MDFRGDASGFLSSGFTPFISLHHWVGWLDLIPGRQGIEVISLLRQGAEAIGGNNLLRRFVWDEGRVTWSAGYSVIVHRDSLSEDDLRRTEHTWQEFQPRRPSRSPRIEGVEKLTYYITAVEKISNTVSIFTHTCTHPSVENGELFLFYFQRLILTRLHRIKSD